jgi:hypothetical protein
MRSHDRIGDAPTTDDTSGVAIAMPRTEQSVLARLELAAVAPLIEQQR